jgi:hypothetical protein
MLAVGIGSNGGGMAMIADQGSDANPMEDDTTWPVLICVLGPFQLLKAGRLVEVRRGGKTEALLSGLALAGTHGSSRDGPRCWRRCGPTATQPSPATRSTPWSTGRIHCLAMRSTPRRWS